VNGTDRFGLETIYALSSAAGRAGVAVVRISGPAARMTVEALSGRPPGRPREAVLRQLADPADGSAIDHALVLWFEGPQSFTGEDVAEFHVHGGRAVVAGLLGALAGQPGLRAAEAGEFTRRAFENGKLDLTAVEGLADLIEAETAAQRRQALRQMDGALGWLYEDWRSRLVRILAYAEAEIDFPDEEVPGDLSRQLLPEAEALASEIRIHLDDGGKGERLREGVEVVILGPPNAGKSSLLNRLAGREAAIVSEEAGTTRDIVEVRLDIGGVPVTLADTAGLREAGGAIEREGIRRALMRAEKADLRIMVDARGADGRIEGDSGMIVTGAATDDIWVLNKADLGGDRPEGFISVSARTGEGMEELISALAARVGSIGEAAEHPMITRARHREGLRTCLSALERGCEGLSQERPVELLAEDLRLAARALGRITGRVDVEDLLDVVFHDFCIGK